jgi:hypothetical protein
MADQEKDLSHICKANGCPLPFEHVTHWYEPEGRNKPRRPKWGVCTFHHEAPADQWTATTRRILDNLRILQLINTTQTINEAELKPSHGEAVDKWISRLQKLMRQRILPDQGHDLAYQPGSFDAIHKLLSSPSPQAGNQS